MIVLRKIRLFLRREEERCAVTACLLFEQGTQIRRDGEHLVDGAVELRAERRVPRCVGEMAREQAQVASGLRARMRVEGVVRDASTSPLAVASSIAGRLWKGTSV